MRNVLVSIITVSYNSKSSIKETIKSVCCQTYQNIEYIIVDGASKDGTKEVIQKSATVDKWVSEKDHGIYHAMNKGIKISSGEIIGILNSDDTYQKGAVERAVNGFTEEIGLVHGKIKYGKNEGSIRRPKRIPFYRFLSTPFKHPSMFVKKNIYKKIGLYDRNFGTAADYEFMLRCIDAGIRDRYIDAIITSVGTSGITTGANNISSKKEVKRIIRKYTKSRVAAGVAILLRQIIKTLPK